MFIDDVGRMGMAGVVRPFSYRRFRGAMRLMIAA